MTATILLLIDLLSAPGATACNMQDIREVCCLAACNTLKSRCWPKADDVLKGCMTQWGCHQGQIDAANTRQICNCHR